MDDVFESTGGLLGDLPVGEGAVGVAGVGREVGDEFLLALGEVRRLGREVGEQIAFFDEEGVDAAGKVAGDEEFELGVGEDAVFGAWVFEADDGDFFFCKRIGGAGALRGADEADDGVAGA